MIENDARMALLGECYTGAAKGETDVVMFTLGTGIGGAVLKNPHTANLATTKTIAILNYGNAKPVFVATNHHHNFGPEHQQSFAQWEGLDGAARITMGVNLDYPIGKPDCAEYALGSSDASRWRQLPITGNNFPDAFMGTMGALQKVLLPPCHRTSKTCSTLWRSSKPCIAQANVPVKPSLLKNDEAFMGNG
jgi:ROK family